ncbi:MAG: hypothetical protein WBL48_20685 [Pseudolabrys sp.]
MASEHRWGDEHNVVLGDVEMGAVFRGVDADLEAVADDRKSL